MKSVEERLVLNEWIFSSFWYEINHRIIPTHPELSAILQYITPVANYPKRQQ